MIESRFKNGLDKKPMLYKNEYSSCDRGRDIFDN